MITRRSILAALTAPVFVPFISGARKETQSKPPVETTPLPPKSTAIAATANGFDEITRAGKRAREAKIHYYPAFEFTLARKRAYLADPACQDALAIFRQGIVKPIIVPRMESFSDTNPGLFSVYTALSHLLAAEITVSFVDKRGDVAVPTVSDGLILAHSIKSNAVMGYLVGSGVDDHALTAAINQREHWSITNCQDLARLAEQWLGVPHPILAALAREQELSRKAMSRWHEKPEEMVKIMKDQQDLGDLDEAEEAALSRKMRDYAKILRRNATVRKRVLDECITADNEYHEQVRLLISDPTKRMAPTPTIASTSQHPITRFLRENSVWEMTIAANAVESSARFQFLRIHAAIRQFRWENNRLPQTLGEMKLAPHLTTDPFTTKPLIYHPDTTGTRYKLASAGALVPGEYGKPDTRTQFVYPTDKPKPT